MTFSQNHPLRCCKGLSKVFLSVNLIWFCVGLMVCTLIISADDSFGSIQVTKIISTFTDLPACIIVALIQVRYDRTKTMAGFLLISCFATSFMTYLKYSEISEQTNDQRNSSECYTESNTDINNSTFNDSERLIFVLMIVFRFGVMSIWNFFCTYRLVF